MFKFFHHLLNPHCPDCKEALEDARVCNSCEVLKLEIERLRIENARLLDRILEKPREEVRVIDTDLKPIMPKTIPWNTRKQMLEQQDRNTAKLKRQNEGSSITLEELEKEMNIVGQPSPVGIDGSNIGVQ